ncbi:MAG TPA: hypothetical protein P5205_07760 [Candidatus Paceibacterota bacterium]|nr:hypothetical protein [Verrucomicrobiota bacterium]HSA10253.1 hypothetical protein [Candidatus Paceibacterota bacterium]
MPTAISREAVRRELQAGVAGHAFDHLGAIGDQAEAAAASGASVIYVTGLGGLGYLGLPPAEELAVQRRATASYLDNARRRGIRLAIGYVCATSIVKLEAFARNWPPELRAQFGQPPAEWRQQDHAGSPLPSWYGGEYQPACMNNPDWRTYERFMVRQQLEAGCDGVFFDNPTVHPQGCYCSHCLEKFARFLRREGVLPRMASLPKTNSQVALRQLARRHSNAFLRFRCTIARDFLADMRDYARSLKRNALITANNSLNSPDVLYSQCRNYAYNIHELSRAEDFVVVEDMSSQPRTLSDGRVMEYGPTYRQLHAISRGKPVVAVTLAEADYHTPPHLVRLAMAEAAAHNASYLSWPTWPDRERERMISLIRPQADFLRRNASLLNDTRARRDLVLFLPFRNWLASDQCRASRLAAALTAANLQFEVVCEDDLWKALRGTKLLLAPSMADFTTNELRRLKGFIRAGGSIVTAEKVNWLKEVQAAIGEPAVAVSAHSTVRAVVRDQPHRTIVHLLNLDVRRLSSFEDTVTPVADLRVAVRVPLKQVRSVAALTADPAATSGPLEFAQSAKGRYKLVNLTIPRLEIATLLLID